MIEIKSNLGYNGVHQKGDVSDFVRNYCRFRPTSNAQ